MCIFTASWYIKHLKNILQDGLSYRAWNVLSSEITQGIKLVIYQILTSAYPWISFTFILRKKEKFVLEPDRTDYQSNSLLFSLNFTPSCFTINEIFPRFQGLLNKADKISSRIYFSRFAWLSDQMLHKKKKKLFTLQRNSVSPFNKNLITQEIPAVLFDDSRKHDAAQSLS